MFASTSKITFCRRVFVACCFSIVLVIWLFSVPADAGEFSDELNLTEQEKAWIAEHPIIRFGMDPNYEPYEFVSPSGEYKGISADYLKLIADMTGLQFERVPGLTWGEVVTRLRRKQLDFAPTMIRTKQREKWMLFTQSYVENPFVIITRTRESGFDSEESLKGKKVALVSDYGVNESLLENVPGVIPIFYTSDFECLKAVSAGKATATVGHLGALAHHIQSQNLTNLKIAGITSFDESAMSMAVRNDWPQLVSILDKALSNIDDAQRNKIAQRWITVEQDIYPDSILYSEIILAALGIILPLTLWNRRLRNTIQFRAGQFMNEVSRRKESEKRFSTLFENAPEAIAVVDYENGLFKEVNGNAVQLFGKPKEELVSCSIWDLCPTWQPQGEPSRRWFRE